MVSNMTDLSLLYVGVQNEPKGLAGGGLAARVAGQSFASHAPDAATTQQRTDDTWAHPLQMSATPLSE
jgi:hypothetical protein